MLTGYIHTSRYAWTYVQPSWPERASCHSDLRLIRPLFPVWYKAVRPVSWSSRHDTQPSCQIRVAVAYRQNGANFATAYRTLSIEKPDLCRRLLYVNEAKDVP